MESSPTLRQLFETALRLSGEARTKLLDEHCRDTRTRGEVEQLLAADALLDDLPGQGDAALAACAIGDPDIITLLPPTSEVGSFELIEVLGQGGSSTVFRAFREEQGVRQEVALKLLAKGLYSSESKRQFRREREALARLRHPGIARLIEGGITDGGLAYIALELVDGLPVTTYAREQNLGLRPRLELFLGICRVVEAAHRALIVHGDLKPSNVLVTAEGEVKLLDFGIAQLLDEDGDSRLKFPLRALTPAYAAPEQFAQGPVTAAADVYALGILLDELLGGQRAEREGTRLGVRSCAPAENTKRPRWGELGYIVRMATEMEPNRRYACAGAMADDIKRHLSRKPVLAYPRSRSYRLRKFAIRYRAGIATTAGLMLAIVVALSVALWQAEVAREQAGRADEVRDFLLAIVESAGADSPPSARAAPDYLADQATRQLLASSHLSDTQRVDLMLSLAKVARRVGSDARALALLDRSAPIIHRLYGSGEKHWWDAQVQRAAVLEDQSRDSEVVKLMRPLRDGLSLRHDRIGIEGTRLLGNALSHVGEVEQGLSVLAAARLKASDSAWRDLELSVSIDEATALLDGGRFHDGLERAEDALTRWQASRAPPSARIPDLYEAVARGAEATGDMARADRAHRLAVTTGVGSFLESNPRQATNVGRYGAFLIDQGRFAEAEPYALNALELRRRAFGNDDPRTLQSVVAMGDLRYGQRNFKQALVWYAQGVESCHLSALRDPVCPRLLGRRGIASIPSGAFDRAASDIGLALDEQRALAGTDNPTYADLLKQLASLQLARRQYAETVVTVDHVLAIYRSAKGGTIQRELDARLIRAQATFGLGGNDKVLKEVLTLEPAYNAMFPDCEARVEVLALKARTLARIHRAVDAANAAQTALAVARQSTTTDPQLVANLTHIVAAGRIQPFH